MAAPVELHQPGTLPRLALGLNKTLARLQSAPVTEEFEYAPPADRAPALLFQINVWRLLSSQHPVSGA